MIFSHIVRSEGTVSLRDPCKPYTEQFLLPRGVTQFKRVTQYFAKRQFVDIDSKFES